MCEKFHKLGKLILLILPQCKPLISSTNIIKNIMCEEMFRFFVSYKLHLHEKCSWCLWHSFRKFIQENRKYYMLLWMFHFSGFYEQNSRRRQISNVNRPSESAEVGTVYEDPNNEARNNQWRRILLLVVAITVYFCKIINSCARTVYLNILNEWSINK